MNQAMKTNRIQSNRKQEYNTVLGIYILTVTLVVTVFSLIKLAPYL